MSKGSPVRNVRVPDEVWEPAKSKAASEGTSVSARINAWLREYAGVTPSPPTSRESAS